MLMISLSLLEKEKNLKNSTEKGGHFSGKNLKGVNFRQVNLKEAKSDKFGLFGINMMDADQDGASLGKAATRDCSGF